MPSAQAVESAGQLLAVAAGTYRLRKSGDDFTLVLGRRVDDAALAQLRAPHRRRAGDLGRQADPRVGG